MLTCRYVEPKPVILTNLGGGKKKLIYFFMDSGKRESEKAFGVESQDPWVLVWTVSLKRSSATNLG